ncbi:unannotated protein [freshwater metagenome]|uniref:Unannotated protein n=1 Tax=freshwater metagenome TaxID=449393 RepID=A0A6J6F3W3_9ZZZZ
MSQSATSSAPAWVAAFTTSKAKFLLLRYPSKKCSASRNTLLPSDVRKATVSLIMAMFSSNVVFKANSTWRSKDFATKVIT